jgi:hypothetical protein
MNSSSPSSAAPNRDLFVRLADRLQLDACLQAIELEGKSVLLHGSSPGLLDHYSQILVQRLRQRLPQVATEIFFPPHTDALIARFNDMLEHVSIDDATQSPGPMAPQKLWIVHDASALPEHELKLLARLLQHLPGARLSAVMVLNGPDQALRNVDPQGRRLLRWDIEPPSADQIEHMVEEARQQGREFAALELVARLTPLSPPAGASRAPAPQAGPPAAAAASASSASSTAPSKAAAPAEAAPARSGPRLWLRTLLILAFLLLVSVGVALWLHPQALQTWRDTAASAAHPEPTASQAAPTPADTEASGPIEAASEAASTPTSAPVAAASAPVAAASVPASSAPLPSAAPAAVSAAASAPAPASAASSPAPTANSRVVTELPDIAVRGAQWLRQLDKDTWVIEHGRHGSALLARKQINADKLLVNARVIPVARGANETAEFLVVTGPFRTQERARNFIARQELGRATTVHTRKELLDLMPAGLDRPARP